MLDLDGMSKPVEEINPEQICPEVDLDFAVSERQTTERPQMEAVHSNVHL